MGSEVVFNHTAHKELWDWLSKNPKKYKSDWEGWNIYKRITASCFACDYADKVTYSWNTRKPCPLMGTCYGFNVPNCLGGLFDKWDETPVEHTEQRILLARQIRDLPVIDGVKTI